MNVAYRVVKIGGLKKREEREKVVLELIKKRLERYRTGKIVVYY